MAFMNMETDRIEFIKKSGRFLAFPIAGAVVWLVLGSLSLLVSQTNALYLLLFGSGAIFPLALALSKLTGQEVFIKENVFGQLAGLLVLMVNLLWALHIVLVVQFPQAVPLSIAIGLGLHWIVYSWIVQAPFGIIHAILRTLLCTVAYFMFPEIQLFAIALAVVFAYSVTLFQLVSFFKKHSELC
jgi:hypothetical protein